MNYRIRWAFLLFTTLGRMAAAGDVTPGILEWAETAFKKANSKSADKTPSDHPFQLSLQRQEHGELQFGKSVMGTPLKIGETVYKHGLGTHANSEITVKLADGVKSFKSFVGVDSDNNSAGTVQFVVERDGKEIFRSATLRGGDSAIPVDIDCSAGNGDLILKTDSTPDGASGDHADWAEAQLVLKNGTTLWVDELSSSSSNIDFLLSDRPPFSFVYDGKTSEALLPQWTQTAETTDAADRLTHIVRWTDPKTGLKIVATVIAFKDFPAVDWVLRFENGGIKSMVTTLTSKLLFLSSANSRAEKPSGWVRATAAPRRALFLFTTFNWANAVSLLQLDGPDTGLRESLARVMA